ncbi:hypothetical protein DLREEDagrD3_28960 [Denitratisoma sp. agr-D3]
MDAWITLDDLRVRGALAALVKLGGNPAPALRDIATIGEASTRMRFRTETGPDGVKWKPSLRVQMSGGRTLTKDGHLSGSVSSDVGPDYAEWGVNRPYAAALHFGATIKARSGGMLRFRLANGAFVSKAQVVLPARPILGVNEEDVGDMLDATTRRINATADNAGGSNVA